MKGLFLGMLANLGLSVLLVFISFVITLNMTAFFFIGIYQLIHVIPVSLIAWFKYRNKSFVQGVLIMAGITFLLNSLCFGLLFAILI